MAQPRRVSTGANGQNTKDHPSQALCYNVKRRAFGVTLRAFQTPQSCILLVHICTSYVFDVWLTFFTQIIQQKNKSH